MRGWGNGVCVRLNISYTHIRDLLGQGDVEIRMVQARTGNVLQYMTRPYMWRIQCRTDEYILAFMRRVTISFAERGVLPSEHVNEHISSSQSAC